MAGVLLFDVAEDAHALGTDRPAVSQQLPGVGGLQEALVGDRGVHKALGADEPGVHRVGDRERRTVRPREDLHAECGVRPDRAPDCAARLGHRGDDLRPDLALEVRRVVHVLDDHAVEAGRNQELRFGRRLRGDLSNRAGVGARGAGQGTHVNHADERLASAEDVCTERDHASATSAQNIPRTAERSVR